MTGGVAPETAPAPSIDLHLHSTASDGSQSPAEVVATVLSAGVVVMALTHHDTVAGVGAAQAAAAGSALRVVPGVELSAYQGDEEVHLLGLHLVDVDGMHAALEAFRVARVERGREIVRRLNAIGVAITFDDVLQVAGDAAIGRPHVARAMVGSGWARDLRDAFDRYLGAGRPGCVDKRRLTLRDAIAMVHDHGGLAILAHPGSACNKARLAALQVLGLDGAEVLHPSHSAEDRRRLLEAVDALGMVPSGGSDSHGATEGPRVAGAMRVPLAWLERQEEAVQRWRQSPVG